MFTPRELAMNRAHEERHAQRHSYLKRLPPENYRGQAYVHWSLTIEDRKTGWLIPIFYYKYREILTHSMFRFGLCCPIYCCMPDHIHLLWVGICHQSDQRQAMRYFRRQLNPVLEKLKARFQLQAYDHVLREEERQRTAFEDVAEYIARNPERKNLVTSDGFRDYPYTGCLVPGYPELKPFEDQYWDRFWRIYSHLHQHGLFAPAGPEESPATSDDL
jgi:REP element-mobilizing transposase RayT